MQEGHLIHKRVRIRESFGNFKKGSAGFCKAGLPDYDKFAVIFYEKPYECYPENTPYFVTFSQEFKKYFEEVDE